MLIKYTFKINGVIYKALFLNDNEAMEFVKDNVVQDNAVVIIKKRKVLKLREILKDNDFTEYYKIETIGSAIIPEFCKAHPYTVEIEEELRRLGLYW